VTEEIVPEPALEPTTDPATEEIVPALEPTTDPVREEATDPAVQQQAEAGEVEPQIVATTDPVVEQAPVATADPVTEEIVPALEPTTDPVREEATADPVTEEIVPEPALEPTTDPANPVSITEPMIETKPAIKIEKYPAIDPKIETEAEEKEKREKAIAMEMETGIEDGTSEPSFTPTEMQYTRGGPNEEPLYYARNKTATATTKTQSPRTSRPAPKTIKQSDTAKLFLGRISEASRTTNMRPGGASSRSSLQNNAVLTATNLNANMRLSRPGYSAPQKQPNRQNI
jgi:hypothetical protein